MEGLTKISNRALLLKVEKLTETPMPDLAFIVQESLRRLMQHLVEIEDRP